MALVLGAPEPRIPDSSTHPEKVIHGESLLDTGERPWLSSLLHSASSSWVDAA